MEDLDNTPDPVEITNDVASTALGAGAPETLSDDPPDDIREFFKEEINKPEKAEKVEDPKAEKTEEKAEKVEEPEKAENDPEPEKAKAKEPEPEKATRQSERRVDRPEAPAHFMPKEKELWRNTPADVQNAVARMVKGHEENAKQYEEDRKFREELKEYDDITRANGTSIKEALGRFTALENTMQSNPAQGLKMLFQELKMTPTQAFGNLMSAYGVTPEQIAAHYRSEPHLYTALSSPQSQPQQQQYVDPSVAQMQQKINMLEQRDIERQEAEQRAQIQNQFVEPFRQSHPRFDELENDIVFFLNSGRIPANMSPENRLEHAYDMAERLNPPSHYSETTARRVEPDSNGQSKSVRSSVGRTPTVSADLDETDDRELFRRMLRSGS